MPLQWGDTGRVVYGPLKTYTISQATARETLLTTPVSLPSTEPGTQQVSFTIQQSDLPSISPSPLSVQYTALLFVGGKNTDVAAQSVSYHLYKNGTAVAAAASQSNIASNYFWTQQHAQFLNVQVGDVISVGLYSASANVNYDYYALVVLPTRMNLGKAYLNKDVNYSNFQTVTLTQGNPANAISQTFNLYPADSTSLNIQTASTINFGALRWNQTYFSGRVQLGDNNLSSSPQSNSAYRPYYAKNTFPGTITFREILR